MCIKALERKLLKLKKLICNPYALIVISLIVVITLIIIKIYLTNSIENLMTPVLTIFGATLVAGLSIVTFSVQQRIARVQKVFFEESLLFILRRFDEAFEFTKQNLALFENVINLIKFQHSSATILLKQIAQEIKTPIIEEISKMECFISFFGENGYILHQWLTMCAKDIREFNLFLREKILLVDSRLQSELQKSEEELKKFYLEIENNYSLLQRHTTLMYLLNAIISIVATLDFKSREELIKDIRENEEIGELLIKVDEAFKTLFAYYKLNESEWVSYLISEKGFRFKFKFNAKMILLIERIPKEDNDLSSRDFKIINKDLELSDANVSIDGRDVKYSKIQLGMANKIAFSEEPLFYPAVKTFNELLKLPLV